MKLLWFVLYSLVFFLPFDKCSRYCYQLCYLAQIRQNENTKTTIEISVNSPNDHVLCMCIHWTLNCSLIETKKWLSALGKGRQRISFANELNYVFHTQTWTNLHQILIKRVLVRFPRLIINYFILFFSYLIFASLIKESNTVLVDKLSTFTC